MLEIIPLPSSDTKSMREARDKECYQQGRSDAELELPRQPAVYYSSKRDIDTYNMGYSAGEKI